MKAQSSMVRWQAGVVSWPGGYTEPADQITNCESPPDYAESEPRTLQMHRITYDGCKRWEQPTFATALNP